MNKQAHVICPYCYTTTRVGVEGDAHHVILCCVDEGGCDKYFVIKVQVSVDVTVYRMEEQENE